MIRTVAMAARAALVCGLMVSVGCGKIVVVDKEESDIAAAGAGVGPTDGSSGDPVGNRDQNDSDATGQGGAAAAEGEEITTLGLAAEKSHVKAGESILFLATANAAGGVVEFSVEQPAGKTGVDVGSILASGRYTAPKVFPKDVASVTVFARIKEKPNVKGSLEIRFQK